MKSWVVDIDRDDIATATTAEVDLQIAEGEILVEVDSFALTANNVTYAQFGKPSGMFGGDLGYWDFFSDRDGAGRLPVWGLGTVVESSVALIEPGQRYYGYYPMAEHAVLTPGHIAADRFTETSTARLTLPEIYNQYQRIDHLADFRAEHQDYWPIFRPLYLTGWLLADQLGEEQDFGVAQVLVTSASSKTAMGFAHAMRQRGDDTPALVGVTSAAHAASLAATGFYDRVITYDAIEALDPATPSALVDMAGDAAIKRRLHTRLGAALRRSIIVGKSHWQAPFDTKAMDGPMPEEFFAPMRVDKRSRDWGEQGFKTKLEQAWLEFMTVAPQVARVEKRHGRDGALAAYRDVLGGAVDPNVGIIVEP